MTALEILLGSALVLFAILPKGKFYWSGAPGTKSGPAIQPAWIARLVILIAGLAAIFDAFSRLRHG